ncbi:MAG: EEP domain-containing protein, partial [Gammaproteobacteria bacterium]
RPHHYLTRGLRHVLPHPASFENLERIAQVVAGHDVVGVQEADAGSLRSYFVNQVEFLARRAGFPYWHCQTNRRVGRVARHSNGLLARVRPVAVEEHRLPGPIPGRGALLARFPLRGGRRGEVLAVLLVHLALGPRARRRQLAFLAERIAGLPLVVVMGDFNCPLRSRELRAFLARTGLEPADPGQATYPSWQPQRGIDHVLCSPVLAVERSRVLGPAVSDHLPVSVELRLPAGLRLPEPGEAPPA